MVSKGLVFNLSWFKMLKVLMMLLIFTYVLWHNTSEVSPEGFNRVDTTIIAQKHKMASCRHWVVLLVVFFLEVIDLSCDWLFYTEVKDSTEPYVINNGYLHWTILGVASLGSLTFMFEVVNLAAEMFTDRGSCVSSDIVSMVSTWVEDVPQIAVALVIAVNTQRVVHWVQYVKAAWSLLEVGVRALGQCVFCCILSNRQNRSTDYLVSLSKFLAQIVVLGCSVGIFMRLLQENH